MKFCFSPAVRITCISTIKEIFRHLISDFKSYFPADSCSQKHKSNPVDSVFLFLANGAFLVLAVIINWPGDEWEGLKREGLEEIFKELIKEALRFNNATYSCIDDRRGARPLSRMSSQNRDFLRIFSTWAGEGRGANIQVQPLRTSQITMLKEGRRRWSHIFSCSVQITDKNDMFSRSYVVQNKQRAL